MGYTMGIEFLMLYSIDFSNGSFLSLVTSEKTLAAELQRAHAMS